MRTPRLAAVLIAALAPLLASAAESELHVYGTLLPFAENARVGDPTAAGLSPASGGATQVPGAAYTGVALPGRERMTSGTSNLGFKGSFEVNEHLKVIWQIESAVSPDGDAPNSLAGRNSALGLSGDWGTALYGNWDTPYKYSILFVGPLRGLSPFDNVLTANPGFNVPGTTTQSGRAGAKADAAFNRRQGNSLQYWSPKVEGFTARLAYSFAEGTTAATATAPSIRPTLLSGMLTYENGPFGARLAYERHQDYFGLAQLGGSAAASATNTSSHDDGAELVAWYAFPTGTKVSAIYERLAYHTAEQAAGQVKSYGRDAFYVLVQQRLAEHQLWGAYGRADAGSCTVAGGGACTANGLGATSLALGYSYALTKTADLFAAYYQTANQRSGSYAAFPSVGTVAPGGTSRGFGLGLLYTFDASWKFTN